VNVTIAERFAGDTAGHQMIVKHDDGLYRHLRFMHHHLCNDAVMRPGPSHYWFDLVTWPGTLTINGDCGTFVFSRVTDMFEFFRSKYGINPQYWAEKLQAPDPRGAKKYSEDVFRQHVVEYVTEAIRYGSAPRGIGNAVRSEIFGPFAKWSTEYEEGAREALAEFGYGDTYTADCSCGDHAEGLTYMEAEGRRITHILPTARRASHKTEVKRVEGFRFTDTWEWDLTDFDWQYLWCCHAIQQGIAWYDTSKAVAA
jgi:hypothetical protein